jgi:hypothetical protein
MIGYNDLICRDWAGGIPPSQRSTGDGAAVVVVVASPIDDILPLVTF